MNMPRWITIAFTVLSAATLTARAEEPTLPRDFKGDLVNYDADKTFKRDGRAEFFILVEGTDKDSTAFGFNPAISATVDPYIGGGFGVGGNINDWMNVNVTLSGGPAHLNGLVSTAGQTVDSSNGRYLRADANLEVYPLRGKITPLVGAGFGLMNLRGNFLGSSSGEFSETDLTYNIFGGVRWNITNNMFIKGIYRITWLKVEDGIDRLTLDGASIQLGWTF